MPVSSASTIPPHSTSIFARKHRTHSLWLALLMLMLIAFATTAGAQSGDTTPAAASASSTTLPSAEQIKSKLTEVEAASGLDDATKSSLTELYRRAQSNVQDAANFDAKAADFAQTLKTAPEATAALLKVLERDPSNATDRRETISSTLSSDDIALRLNNTLADVAAAETRVSELEKRIDSGANRPTQARARLTELTQLLEQLDADLKQPAVAGESPDLAQARRWALETRRQAQRAESRMLEQEVLSQAARDALYKAQRDQSSQNLLTLKARQQALEEAQNKRRTAGAEAAQRASEQAQREAENKHPLVQELAQQNADITTSLAQLTKQLDGLNGELTRVESERKRIEEDYRGSRQRLEAAGLSKALGQVLLDRRSQLPSPRQHRKLIAEREDAIAEATLRQIRYREEEQQVIDYKNYIRDLTANDETAQTPLVQRQLAETLQQRKPLLVQALAIEDDYIRQLGELNYASEQVVQIATKYDAFLAERLLWVRNAAAVSLETLTALPAAIGWLLAPEGWLEVGRALVERISHAFGFWLGLAGIALLFWKGGAMRRGVLATAEPLRRVRTDGVRFTLAAIGWTLLAALPLPLLFWLLGQQLLLSTEATAFTRAWGTALTGLSFGLYYLLAFRLLCVTGGVADRHFRWRTETLAKIRRDFDWFTVYIIPVSLLTMAVYAYNDATDTSSLGRLSLIACMFGFGAFFASLLNHDQGVLKRMLAANPDGWLNRMRHLWFPFIVGAPLALAGLALFGYVYTAGILFQSLVYQTWLVLALVVLHQSIVRWLIVARRRLALQAALDRQAARRAAEAEPGTGGTSEVLQAEEPEPDLAALDEQTRRLINASIFFSAMVGLWWTWSDVLPAFSLFERFVLWHYTGLIDGTEQLIPVTVADGGLVLIILIVSTIAAKNLPALLEILLLQSSSVSAGGRYAIKTLSSYVITIVAFLLAFSTLGLSWSQVQWLAAALSVGIGFGLQEIVANFISGLIILFERPVRVGDIVTIGDTTGVVTNIQIRATTIRNWDKQELLVPNKEFITKHLLNWTLTDQQNRITIPLGLEYGSDTKKAMALLAQIAEQHERLLKDPAPLISFEGFSESSLTIVLRCYMDSLDGKIGVITDLHQAIYETFANEGLPIAFPQREVSLSTREPLQVRLHRSSAQDAADNAH